VIKAKNLSAFSKSKKVSLKGKGKSGVVSERLKIVNIELT